MSDFTTFNLQYNTGTDASPVWTGTALAFAGTAGANEIRFCPAAAGGAATPSASWPYVTRVSAGTAVIPEAWACSGDTSCAKINYDGTSAHYMELRWNFDALGTFAAAPQFSCFANSTHTAPSPGTQPPGTNNDPISNGSSVDSSSTAYLKINAYGYGVDVAGAQQTPASNAAGTLTVTSGTAGGVSPATGAWLATWQSAQGFTQYIVDNVVPKATTAGFWYWVFALYQGVSMTTGTLTPVVTMQYSYS